MFIHEGAGGIPPCQYFWFMAIHGPVEFFGSWLSMRVSKINPRVGNWGGFNFLRPRGVGADCFWPILVVPSLENGRFEAV